MRRLLASSAVASALLSFIIVSAPAQASTNPGGGGPCSNVPSWSRPSAGVVRLTWTTKCSSGVFEIYHGMTLQRSGKTVTKSLYCYSSSGTLKTCKKSIDITNPSGSQRYSGHDELAIDDTFGDGMNPSPYGLYASSSSY